ncbi:MAG: murein transglycosylase A [Legionellales bacterium]|nr:murein transglycosylase A [Legionellales bacterium]
MFSNKSILLKIIIVLAIIATALLYRHFKVSDYSFHLEETTFDKLPGWSQDNLENLMPIFTESCTTKTTKDTQFPYLKYYDHKSLKKICKRFLSSKTSSAPELKKFIQTNFAPYKVVSNIRSLFTGYYAPIIQGSFIKTSRYKFPVYTKPDDLVIVPDLNVFIPEKAFFKRRIAGRIQDGKLIPYFTRKEIENGAIKNKNLEILWVDNKVELFFLQIQGSGLVQLPNGSILTLSYNGTNGHKYTSIGKHLIEIGELEKQEVSMQSIKAWLKNNPQSIENLLNKNKSYVFSKIIEKNGVYGSQKTKLASKRSIAVDVQYFPLGLPVWINTNNPINKSSMQFLAISQDTGGAIKGPRRIDIFCGYGDQAAKLAGKLKETGEIYILLPKNRGKMGKFS